MPLMPCLWLIAASHWAINVVGTWIRPMPRYSVDAMKPHTLHTTPPPSEISTERSSMPSASTSSTSRLKLSIDLALSPSGVTIRCAW